MNNYLSLEGEFNKDCKVFNHDIEDDAITQITNILNTKGFGDVPVRIMPDCHAGKGICIGFTAPLTKIVNPSYIGVDIGCAVTMCITNADVNEEEYQIIEHRIKKEIPMGFEINKNRVFEMKEFIKFLKSEYNRARSKMPEYVNDIEISELYISKLLKRIGMDEGTFCKSISSLGGGNHFIEVGSLNGKYAFTVHCGSRNFGLKVCKYWENIATSSKIDSKVFKERVRELKNTIDDKTLMPQRIEEIKAEMLSKCAPCGYLRGDDMVGYITDMVIAQAYSKFNHLMITKKIGEILKKVNGAEVIDTIQSIHNYIDMDDGIIRKGAIRSYLDEKILVPFNMRDGIAICIGKSNRDWNYSCSHGAGRKMSRNKARETINMDDYKKSMDGIYSTSINFGTIDESPMAYKDTLTIIHLLQDTCDIIDIVKPVISIKAGGE